MTELVLSSGGIAVAACRKPESMSDLSSKYDSSKLLVVKMDVNEQNDIDSGFAKAKEAFGRIDVVFNNAGYSLIGETEAVPLEKAKALFEVGSRWPRKERSH
jgi:NADP-dependent 3-hydroxy acid dehydrogenase YdfG